MMELKFGDTESINLRNQCRIAALQGAVRCRNCGSLRLGLWPVEQPMNTAISWACAWCDTLTVTDLDGKVDGEEYDGDGDEEFYSNFMEE